jgi:hypothetical protein
VIKIFLNNEKGITDFHYENLTKKVGREWNVVDRIKRLIKKHTHNPQPLSMYRFLLSKVERDSTGFSILTAKPADLNDFINDFETKFSAIILSNSLELGHIFYYYDYKKWKAYELAMKIDVNVCPYCNRMYTFTIGNDKRRGTRFEFDHFYLKSKYPYLALSFYNLIPSCHVCNSNFKGSKDFTINNNIHPYIEGFSSDVVFSIKPRSIQFINGNHSAYRIKFKKGINSNWDQQKIKAAFENITTFRITELHNMHKDYVDEIIQKSIVYNPDYISGLFNQFQGSLFKNVEDVHRFVLGNYTEEYNYQKRALSKVTADISKELGLI